MKELAGIILSILTLISIGFFSKKTGLLKKEHASVLNNIIIHITMPALIFRAVFESDISLSLLKIPVLAIAIAALSMAVAYIIGRFIKLERATFGALLLVAAIGNTGYLGYPLTLQLFGLDNLVKAVFYDLSGTVLFTFTIGLVVAERFGRTGDKINIVKELATFPPLLGFIAALVLRNFELPTFLSDTIGFLANASIPLIMLSIGLALEVAEVKRYKALIGVVGAVKLVVAPLIAFFASGAIGMVGSDLGIIVLEASMPTFLLSLVIGLRYGLDTDFIPAAIVTTTAVSMVTVPVWQYLLM